MSESQDEMKADVGEDEDEEGDDENDVDKDKGRLHLIYLGKILD